METRYSTAQLVQPLSQATGSIGTSIYGGSVVASSAKPVAPLMTSLSGNDRRGIIQIETPVQAPTTGGPLALNVDPQLSVDSKQSFNAFESSVLHSGAAPTGPAGPVPTAQHLYGQAP